MTRDEYVSLMEEIRPSLEAAQEVVKKHQLIDMLHIDIRADEVYSFIIDRDSHYNISFKEGEKPYMMDLSGCMEKESPTGLASE